MAEQTKSDPGKPQSNTAAQNAALLAENEKLRAQLAQVGGARVATPRHTFQLSEGDRQELEIRGVVNVGGRLMTTEEVRAAMVKDGQDGVEIADAPDATRINVTPETPGRGPGIRGFDYVFPSIEPGKIDPAVAGTPGISGPAADTASTDQA